MEVYTPSLMFGGSSLRMLCVFEKMQRESEPKSAIKTIKKRFLNFSSQKKTSKTTNKLAGGDHKQSTAQIVPQVLAEHTQALPKKLPSLTNCSQ